MTNTELDELESKAKAATPGPWQHPGRALVASRMSEDQPLVCNCISQKFAQAPKDATYIAAANPAVILELIAELQQARKERDWLAKNLERSEACYSAGDCYYCLTRGSCSECKYTTKEHWLKAAKEACQ